MEEKRPRRLDLTGQTFGQWTVLERADVNSRGAIYWRCRCSCGAEKSCQAGSLRNGTSISCGHDMARHGFSLTPTGRAWYGMRQRCNNPNDKDYSKYGGRGIKVCARWLERIENFIEDMGPAPKGKSIDRIDVHGNYEPSNCRWATRSQQQRNRTNNPRVVYRGESVTEIEIAERVGLPLRVLRWRLANNWDVNRAIETPLLRG